jgi:hypothetical protein
MQELLNKKLQNSNSSSNSFKSAGGRDSLGGLNSNSSSKNKEDIFVDSHSKSSSVNEMQLDTDDA